MLIINYDNKINETEAALKVFWKKYSLRRTVMLTIVYAIFTFVFVDMIVVDRTSLFGWIGSGLCLGFLISQWLRPGRARKKLIAALELTAEERYSAAFYDDRIEIETIIVHTNSEQEQKPDKSTIGLASEELYAVELNDTFLLFVNRSLIYIFPKRCLESGQESALREYLNKI